MKASAAATPAILVALAAGAFAYARWIDRGSISDLDRAGRKRDVFPSFRPEEVSRIDIERPGEAFTLERGEADGGSWSVLLARREDANPAAVELMLRELELATKLRDVGDPPGGGFDAPRVRGSVVDGPLHYRFALGADAPQAEGGAYMRIDGEGTFVVGRSLKVQLMRGSDAYRDRTIVALGAGEVARLEVRAESGGYVLERRGATFRLSDGVRASRSGVDRVFSALADMRAESFLESAAVDRGPPQDYTVVLQPRDTSAHSVVELRVGGQCAGMPEDVMVFRRLPSPVAACVGKSIIAALATPSEALRDDSPLYAHADEIEQIRLESTEGGARVEMARKGGGWRLRAPEDRDLGADESDSANLLAVALAGARADGFAGRARSGQAFAPRFEATVIRSGDEAREVVELSGVQAGDFVLARRADDGVVLRLSRSIARRFEPHAVAIRPRAVWSSPVDPAAVVSIDDGCAPATERLQRVDGGWRMLAPRGFAADALSVADLIAAVGHATAEAWVDEKDDGTFGFDGPGSCSVELTLEDGQADAGRRQVGLVFGASTEGGVYARALGDPGVFVAPAILRGIASHVAVDRRPLRIDADRVTSVSFTRGASKVTLERRGDHLAWQGDPPDAADSVSRLTEALESLYPPSVMHTGGPAREEGIGSPALEITAHEMQDAGARDLRITVGAEAQVDGADVYFARASGLDATFVVPRQAVRAILGAM
ncbi:MAG TPA: DUF4340 domain-containing protein [Polyangiaceae bacterium]